MDDQRFDQLVKAVASGASRRSLLKGMLGLGGAALVGGTALGPDVNAARRPTPTPRPPRCPGQQTWNGAACVCPATTPEKCGPDCCNPAGIGTAHSECCDNACCHGTCYGEELCCPVEDFCPGGGTSPDLCCTNNTTCCGAGTDGNICVDISNGGCCAASECGPLEPGACFQSCEDNECVSFACNEGTICCQGACVRSFEFPACPADPDGCCDLETDICCGAAGCCPEDLCNQQAGVCCKEGTAACGAGCCASGQCNRDTGECCLPNTSPCGEGCCLAGQCTENSFCCPNNAFPCGENCCDNGTQRCTGQGVCECLPFFILCDNECISAQCCGSDASTCAALGFDSECVFCVDNQCMVAGAEFDPCDDGAGWCNNGICEACLDSGQACTAGTQCCSDFCNPILNVCMPP